MPIYDFQQVARLPLPGDNVAIVTRCLPAGSQIRYDGQRFTLSHTLLEGHRFAVMPIAAGQALLSWQLPFGFALRPLAAGDYVCNQGMIEALRLRNLDFALPGEPNFADKFEAYHFDAASFQPAEQLPGYVEKRTFMGYRRTGNRGVGTRNMIVLLGVSSRAGGFVRQLATRLQGVADDYANIDGIVAVAHTEGDTPNPNNQELVLRGLAGFMLNPNVGAVLAVDYGNEAVTGEMLRSWMAAHGYSLGHIRHRFVSLSSNFLGELSEAETIVRGWLGGVNQIGRTPESLAHLKIALQCGGSDAFSGVSANPLIGWVAREIIRYGGAANLAETDELIGAESYVLAKVRSPNVAERFLAMVERFKERVVWHGTTAEGNPSGGNKFRGLYNITLKSIGAAMKKDPTLRLDYAIGWGELMAEPGFYFMDSPGNDLESIAGQVASGCNLIFFTTGNGSVTNFPFVPTLKVVTTTERFQLLENDMDVNAGAYLDGVAMDELGEAMLNLTVDIASGKRSVGELAGHAQVQLWRNWQQTGEVKPAAIPIIQQLDGAPLQIQHAQPSAAQAMLAAIQFPVFAARRGPASEQVGLILPTSLCAGQIAQIAARRLNAQGIGRQRGITRFVALAHTEGCGASTSPERLYPRTMLGYMTHPAVSACLLLEHGCEVTHNDYMREQMRQAGLDLAEFGWASIQLDGGIDKVLAKIERWFNLHAADTHPPRRRTGGLETLRIALNAAGLVSPQAGKLCARLAQTVVEGGGVVITPENSPLWHNAAFTHELGIVEPRATLAYAQPAEQAGLHVMATPTQHWVETLVGMGAGGTQLFLAHVGQQPMPGHPLVPLLQITSEAQVAASYSADLDLSLIGAEGMANGVEQALHLVQQTMAGGYTPAAERIGNLDFQLTRGLLTVSL